ncbi:MAG: transcriptional activator domain-containing protein, partial [Chloroflexales bacterium]|nr:transcriptional activator domain-containing protein [Chloroflexales bacterium]
MTALQRERSPAFGTVTVEVALLGPPQVRARGEPLPMARRQLRALLYRLAVELKPVPREQLGFLLWPDLPEHAARRNLTVLLSQLRQALPPTILVSGSAGIALDPALVQVDTAIAAALATAGLRQGRLDQLAAAAELYRGPFLDGVALPDAEEFESWITRERQVWERWYLDLLSALVEGYAVSGDYPAAITAAQRALATDPLAEEQHRWLIELYGALGDRGAAMRQFEQCVILLERELGVAPLSVTRAAYEAVRDGTATPPHGVAGSRGAWLAISAPQPILAAPHAVAGPHGGESLRP